MSNRIKVRLMILLLVLLVVFLLFQPNLLEVREGERVFVFHLPGEAQPGGSVGADLSEQLRARHGAETVCDFFYLGRSFNGTRYILCMLEELRYIAVDDGNLSSEARAEVLWDTAYEP